MFLPLLTYRRLASAFWQIFNGHWRPLVNPKLPRLLQATLFSLSLKNRPVNYLQSVPLPPLSFQRGTHNLPSPATAPPVLHMSLGSRPH